MDSLGDSSDLVELSQPLGSIQILIFCRISLGANPGSWNYMNLRYDLYDIFFWRTFWGGCWLTFCFTEFHAQKGHDWCFMFSHVFSMQFCRSWWAHKSYNTMPSPLKSMEQPHRRRFLRGCDGRPLPVRVQWRGEVDQTNKGCMFLFQTMYWIHCLCSGHVMSASQEMFPVWRVQNGGKSWLKPILYCNIASDSNNCYCEHCHYYQGQRWSN